MNPARAQGVMPAVFVSHGAPTVVAEDGAYQDALAGFGRKVKPRAIAAISAHWGTGTSISISSAVRYATVHDFGGFPRALYEMRYDAPGSPALAQEISDSLRASGWETSLDSSRGLDHGVWVPLKLMYPEANIPVVALSLPVKLTPETLFSVGEALAPLRAKGVMVLGSGGIVHNLGLARLGAAEGNPDDWAAGFDEWFRNALERHDLDTLFRYRELAPHADLAVPTFEHFAPAFVVLGAASTWGNLKPMFQGFQMGNISLQSFAIA